MPCGPFRVSRVCSWPNWSRAENAGAFCPTASPIEVSISRDATWMVVAFERPLHGNAVSQMTDGLRLRVEIVNLPDGIVIQNELCSRHFLRALRRLGKGFVGGAAAVDDDAGPRSGICHVALSRRAGSGSKIERK